MNYFSASDIHFAKNIKRDGGTGWAFMEDDLKDEFYLTFSITQVKAAKELKPGVIVLLFQRVDKITRVKNHTYLTHLVTPADYLLHEVDDPGVKFRFSRRVFVIARANPKTAIYTNSKDLSFRTPNRGKLVDINYLSRSKSREEIQLQIWSMFDGHFNADNGRFLNDIAISDREIEEAFSVVEGRELRAWKEHLMRERSPVIIEKAKAEALRKGNGSIKCECCDFDFFEVYGHLGYGFIECHHRLPIQQGQRETKISDLAMVCSNCHRMLHRKNEKGKFLLVNELYAILHREKSR